MISTWLTYNQEANQRFYSLIKENSLFENEKIQALFSHLLVAEHIWYSRILEKEPAYKVWEKVELPQLVKLSSLLESDKNEIIAVDIKKEISYRNSKGQSFSNSVEDVLLHVVNHASYHRGQISEELKRLGIQPPETDYIFYKRNK